MFKTPLATDEVTNADEDYALDDREVVTLFIPKVTLPPVYGDFSAPNLLRVGDGADDSGPQSSIVDTYLAPGGSNPFDTAFLPHYA
jgi:hypothetical protein